MNYSEKDLIRIAKRENNTKRGYLIVDPLQGKHIPVSPTKALALFDTLADIVKNEYPFEKLLLIGFAETATAIGARAAIRLGAKYIQTTREEIDGADFLYFSENHSHASEQRLMKNDLGKALESADRVVFIEDELTTGNTILNLVKAMRAEYGDGISFSVASLLNGMTLENTERFERENIRFHYILKIINSGYEKTAAEFADDGDYYPPDTSDAGAEIIEIGGYINARRLTDGADYSAACDRLAEDILAAVPIKENEKILVVGTEEFMYPALYFGMKLEKLGHEVRCHSTTRSPITVCKSKKYPLSSRYELKSLYDGERRTFLYNIGAYGRAIVLTDANAGKTGLNTLVNALKSANKTVNIVRWR